MNRWVIVDWMSNRCFADHNFKTYEDGWDFLYEKFSSDDDLGEYYVIKTNNL